jgi:hypothetical protein
MPRLNTGVQGSPLVSKVLAKDRITDATQGSPVLVGTAAAGTRKTPGAAGSPILLAGGGAEPLTWAEATSTWATYTQTWSEI